MSSSRLFLTLLVALLVSSSHAHDYWFEIDGDDYLLHRGHRFSEHQGEKEVPFEPRIITGSYCLAPQQDTLSAAAIGDSYPLRVAGPCDAVMVTADSGYWSQTLTGTRNQAKDELFGVLRSWQSMESVKRVDTWSERLLDSLSNDLELVFTENPFVLDVGDKLRLTVLFRGQPAAGVTVAYDGDPRGITGDDGRVNLRIRHKGLQMVAASLEESLQSSKADKRVRSTILMFEIE